MGLSDLKLRTLKARHSVAKVFAPKLVRENARYYRRPMITFLSKNEAPMVGVEIGVALGGNAEKMLETLVIKKLYLVDPYIPYYERNMSLGLSEHEQTARKRLTRFRDQTEFIKKLSSEAKDDIPNDVDFVYIDGNHEYAYVKQDIEDYYPKVKTGGVIGGHDFCASFFGVCKAVLEFAENNNLELFGEYMDWWLIKK